VNSAVVLIAALSGAHIALMLWHIWSALSHTHAQRKLRVLQERCIEIYRELHGSVSRREMAQAITDGWNRRRR